MKVASYLLGGVGELFEALGEDLRDVLQAKYLSWVLDQRFSRREMKAARACTPLFDPLRRIARIDREAI